MNLCKYSSVLCYVLFGLCLFIQDCSCACNPTAVIECTSILSKSTDSNMTLDGITAIPAVDQLKKLCGAMSSFKACYIPKSKECTKDLSFSMTFGTIENTIEYLCVEGYDAILEHASCWNQTEVTAETTFCHMDQNRMTADLLTQQKSGVLEPTELKDLWCQILDNTTTCMQRAVSTRCGEVPGCIMRTMMTRALKSLAGLMQCTSPQSSCEVPVHTDGTVHVDGDLHSDHADDHGHAHTEVTAEPENGANSNSFYIYSYILSLCLMCHVFCPQIQ
ncbi:hypothetical protein ACF0H5_008839 [Mactra antiquata]